MQAKREDLAAMLQLQKVDLDILQARKKLDELPQRAKLEALASKHSQLDAKKEQVDAIKEKAESEVAKLEGEDNMLAEKQHHAQELIDMAGQDYRMVESHSRELESFAKRRDTINDKLGKLAEELEKVASLEKQIADALAVVTKDEDELNASYESESSVLREQLSTLEAQHDERAAGIPADLMKLYERAAKRAGGVAIGVLDDNRCGVCRTPIDGGRLIELRSQAPLGECPSCRRLLVID